MRHLFWISIMAAWAFTGCATIDRVSESGDTKGGSLHAEAIRNAIPEVPELGELEGADESLYAEAQKNAVGEPFVIAAEEDQPAEEVAREGEEAPSEDAVAGEECDKDIISMSAGAVGNPCMTTEEFMEEELGFNDQKIDEVLAMRDSVGRALAH